MAWTVKIIDRGDTLYERNYPDMPVEKIGLLSAALFSARIAAGESLPTAFEKVSRIHDVGLLEVWTEATGAIRVGNEQCSVRAVHVDE